MDFFNLFSAFTYGLSSSLSLCLASCLPFYMPILFGYGEDRGKGFRMSLGFAAGRFSGYFMLGAVAAYLGGAFIDFFNTTLPGVTNAMILLFGVLTIFWGSLVLAKAKLSFLGEGRCKSYLDRTKGVSSPFLASASLGFVSTVSPCVPVFTFLLLPFALGRVWETSLVTVAFGLGANMVFIVIGVAVGLGMENVRERFQKVKRPLEVFSAAVLMVLGVFYVLWAVGPWVFGWGNASHVLPSVYDFADFLKYVLGIR